MIFCLPVLIRTSETHSGCKILLPLRCIYVSFREGITSEPFMNHEVASCNHWKPAPEIPNNPTLRRSIGELKKCPEHWNFEPKVMFLSWMFFFNDMSGFFHGRVKPLRWTSARENVQGEVYWFEKPGYILTLKDQFPWDPKKFTQKFLPWKRKKWSQRRV